MLFFLAIYKDKGELICTKNYTKKMRSQKKKNCALNVATNAGEAMLTTVKLATNYKCLS